MLNGNGKHAAPLVMPQYEIGVQPPNSEQAEEAVLGSILLEPEIIVTVAAIVTPEMFYNQRNREVYTAMVALDARHEPIDYVTVSQELRKDKVQPDTEVFLSQLPNAIFTSLNFETYAQKIAAKFLRRRMLAAANTIVKLAYDEKKSETDCMAEAGRAVLDFQQDRNADNTSTAHTATNALLERIEFMHNRTDKSALLGVSTGFMDWDKMTSGNQKGDYIIVAARPSMGKSALLKDMAVSACKAGKRVLFLTVETNTEQLMTRIMCGETGIPSDRLKTGDLRDDEWPNLTKVSMQIADWKLWVDDTAGLSIPAMRSKVNRIYQRHGLDAVFVDYLGLMQANAENRVQEVSQISLGLKQIAREFGIPLIAAAQLSRAVEQRADKRPQLSDLRDSGSLEQDADIAAFIYRDEYYNDNTDQKSIANINIAKNRNGPTGSLNLFFDKRLTSFKNLSRERIQL